MAGYSFGLFSSCMLVTVASLGYIILCPYTKVEESFNLQAMHDHIHHGVNLTEFDHIKFPGVVPRTFVGSLLVGYLAKPVTAIADAAGGCKFIQQYVVRCVLCVLVLWALFDLLASVKQLYGASVATWSTIICCSQFHFLYYVSRPLPNTFATILVLRAYSSWLRNRSRDFVFYAGFTIIVFRCELAIMFGLMLLISLVYSTLTFFNLIKWIISTGLISLAATVLADSYYWQRLAWPELEAFHFNAILNKSSEWGTSPFLWYFYSALPRCTGFTLVLVPLGMIIDRRCLVMCAPALGYVLLYSILPHKELRFILYVVPILNISAARTCSMLWINKHKAWSRMVAALAVIGLIVGNLLLTGLFLSLSYYNYPGGVAMSKLHELVPKDTNVSVHIDVYTAQTGVSRFNHLHDTWRYDKSENLALFDGPMMSFSHLMVGTPDESDVAEKIGGYRQSHQVLHTENCFKNLAFLGLENFPYFDIIMKPCVWILQRR